MAPLIYSDFQAHTGRATQIPASFDYGKPSFLNPQSLHYFIPREILQLMGDKRRQVLVLNLLQTLHAMHALLLTTQAVLVYASGKDSAPSVLFCTVPTAGCCSQPLH